MSEVQGLAELGLLPNQLKHTQPATADSISIKATVPRAQHGNLTGPTSYSGELWCEDVKPQRLRKDSGWGSFVHLSLVSCKILSAQILPVTYCQ